MRRERDTSVYSKCECGEFIPIQYPRPLHTHRLLFRVLTAFRKHLAEHPPACARCGAELRWNAGPQWSGWIAPALDGKLRDVCYADDDGVWQDHALKRGTTGR